jgi:hypothetical protein
MKLNIAVFTLLCGLLLPCNLIAHPTIGAIPDGVSYEVIRSTTINKFDPGHCGFNDLSLPNVAEYRRETRRYTMHMRGKEVKSWIETRDVFVRCKPL